MKTHSYNPYDVSKFFDVPLGELEKIPRLQAKALVSLRYYGILSQRPPIPFMI